MAKKLYRSEKEKIIAGVAGGLGEYFDIDPVIVRIVFILLTLLHGAGIIIYIALALVVPRQGAEEKLKEVAEGVEKGTEKLISKMRKQKWMKPSRAIGIIALAAGVIVILTRYFPSSWFRWDVFWAVVLIVMGVYLLLRKKQN